MTPAYIVFMVAMLAAWLLMVVAWFRTVLFFKRHKQPEQSTLNPFHGIALWRRLFRAGGFGDQAEPKRKQITRLYLLALASFALAIVFFLTLPGMPG